MKQANKYIKTKERIHKIIFDSDTYKGKLFDIILLILIVLSIFIVMFESMPPLRNSINKLLYSAEWIITILFTIEYFARIVSSNKPSKYILSFLGIIDLLSILPTYFALIIPNVEALIIIRSIRLLRVFRILKLYRFIRAGNLLIIALRQSMRKILIFMFFVLILVTLLGSLMYVIENQSNGFTSIPNSIYWAVMTLTTVGYGDIVPVSGFGKFISTFIMLLGYSIIAIPTGIVSVEMSNTFSSKSSKNQKICNNCNATKHSNSAAYCYKCGNKLDELL